MKSVIVGINNRKYEWMVDLFWYHFKKHYGPNNGEHEALFVLMERNTPYEESNRVVNFKRGYPHLVTKPYFDYNSLLLDMVHDQTVAINLQYGLLQAIGSMDDEEIVQLLDCDMYYMKHMPIPHVNDDEVLVDTSYERWHLFATTENKYILDPYLAKNHGPFNGGFIPIIAKVKTWKKIIPLWIDAHIKILRERFEKYPNTNETWWSGMFSFSVACANAHISMIPHDIMYTRGVNDEHINNTFIAHYCCDHIFIPKNEYDEKLFSFDHLQSVYSNNDYPAYLDPFKEWVVGNSIIKQYGVKVYG